MPLEDTAHQTFSTVPEVLAGLVALLAAFALFRIGGLQRRISELGEGTLLAAGVHGDIVDRVRHAFTEHRRHVINGELDRLHGFVPADRMDGYDKARGRLDAALVYRARLIAALTLAIWISVLAMAGSVLLLALTQPLMDAGPAAVYASFVVPVGGLVAALAANTRVLYMLLEAG